ncbi:MAG: diaminopimelate epimerase, partial [Candidatus Nanopelagicales bacterium]
MGSAVEYVKGHGTKNDFVIVEDLEDVLEISSDQVKAICDRNNGIGADGVLRVVKTNDQFFMDYRNADGSIAEMCGNGARVFGLYLKEKNLVTEKTFSILTRGGEV